MSISFQCEHCRKEIKAPDNAGGQRGKCPYCGGSTYVPAVGDDEQALPLTPVDNEAERRHEEELHRLVDQELSQLDEDDMREQVPLDQRDEVSSRDLHHFVVNYCLDMAAGKLDRAETHAEKLAAYGKTGTQAVDEFLMGNALEPALDDMPPKVKNGYLNQLREKISA
ncbi:MAG: RNHCP domain-containing protein [Phycisphaerae bacterium]|nr:RNHCP domain-containing protein [Phycisphaerae bacterium]